MIIGVIGSGSIGPDLAYGFLSAIARKPGAKVFLVDIRQDALDAGVARIKGYAEKGVARGKLSAKAARGIADALVPTMALADLKDCSYVLEAASEDLAVKRRILADLEAVVSPDCLIGFATSGIPRKEIAASAKHPDRCFVNHPFYPAWRSLPIEVVLSGDDKKGAAMLRLLEGVGKVPIVTADVACFAADDVFCNYISEAVRIADEGVASPAQVDKIVDDAIGGGGPFNVMDLTRGNLLVHKCQLLMQGSDVHASAGGDWFAPPAGLAAKGNDAWRKSGDDGSYDSALRDVVMDRILAVLLGRSYFVVDNAICPPTESNWLMRMALGFRQGTLEIAAELGAARVRAICQAYAAKHPGFVVSKSIADGALGEFRRFTTVTREPLAGGEVGIIRVWRPEVKNALSKRTIAEIEGAFDELAGDSAVKGIVVSSYDGALAGADITELAALRSPDECRALCMGTHPIMEKIAAAKKPVVAAVDGPVLGGGAELSMACHARVVGKALMMGQPEVNLGIIPGYGGTQRLPRLVGVARAVELLRTGRPIGAAEACAWGWAHGAPVADPVGAAKQLIADHVAGKVKLAPVDPAPVAVPDAFDAIDIEHRSTKIDAILVGVIRDGLRKSLHDGLAVEADGFAACKATVDMDIGMKNFMQNGPRVPAQFLNE